MKLSITAGLVAALVAALVLFVAGDENRNARATRDAPTVPATSQANDRLNSLRVESGSPHYVPPTAEELAIAEELFRTVLHNPKRAVVGRATTLARRLSLEVVRVSFGAADCVVIREAIPVRGWGVFVVRVGESLERDAWMLQAPHCVSDRHTGTIVARLFVESSAAAVAFNTAHRTKSTAPDGTALPLPGADLCHRPDGILNRFTRAFGRQCPDGRVVQVHGFSRAKRKSAAGRRAIMIVSDGTRRPDAVRQIVGALRLSFPANDADSVSRVMLYPVDVPELGGTTNAQGAQLRRIGVRGFVHLELALPVREKLVGSAEVRRRLLQALESAARARR